MTTEASLLLFLSVSLFFSHSFSVFSISLRLVEPELVLSAQHRGIFTFLYFPKYFQLRVNLHHPPLPTLQSSRCFSFFWIFFLSHQHKKFQRARQATNGGSWVEGLIDVIKSCESFISNHSRFCSLLQLCRNRIKLANRLISVEHQ